MAPTRELHDDGTATMLDLAFAVKGAEVPRAYRGALADALERALPWLADEPDVAVHRLNLVGGAGAQALLSGRTRLTLRVPRRRVADALALCGTTLDLEGHVLGIGAALQRELLAFGTQYAHFVAAAPEAAGDELAFLAAVEAELEARGVRCRAICGREQALEAGAVRGYSLMLDGLTREGALCVLEHGVGRYRRWGCGVFVPHKSAAAVGMPP